MSSEPTEKPLKLNYPPIVEAVVDIDCDLPPDLDFRRVEQEGREALKEVYPGVQQQTLHNFALPLNPAGAPQVNVQQGLSGIRFHQPDGKQLVQFRSAGYSFNRLAPYSSLDDYFPEIARTWGIFKAIAKPKKVRRLSLRTINRILLPLENGSLPLEKYLTTGPKLPPCHDLQFTGFLNQHQAVVPETGHQVRIVMTIQPPEGEFQPLILDIDAFANEPTDGLHWEAILAIILISRTLRNDVFKASLTQSCLDLFSHPPSQPER